MTQSPDSASDDAASDSASDDAASDSASDDANSDDGRARRARATVGVMVGAVMVSFAPVFVRSIEMAPTVSAFWRMLLGGAVLAALVTARGVGFRCGRAALVWLVAAGVLFALDLAAWHRSIWYVGPGLATMLGNFQVFAMALAGVALFGERLRWQLIASIVIAVVGLGLIIGVDLSALDDAYRRGLMFGLLTAVFYSSYILTLRQARVAEPAATPMRDLAIASLVAALALGAIAGGEGASFAIPDARTGGLLLAYALVAQVLGWVLISGALPHVPASRVGLILLLQPCLAFVWDVSFFDRAFGTREAVGAALVLAGIYVGIWLGARPVRRRA